MKRAFTWFLLLAPLVAAVAAQSLDARAGGGGDYVGGGRGYSGGGGGGEGIGVLIYFVFRIVLILWTEGGIVGKIASVVIVVAAIYFIYRRMAAKKVEERHAEDRGRLVHSRNQQRRQHEGLRLVREFDPNFSRVLFIDFAHLVFVKYHESRGGLARRSPEQFAVAPYLTPQLRERVKASSVEIGQVVVASLSIGRASASANLLHVAVRYRANVVEDGKRIYLEQRLIFKRPKSVTTRAPEKVLALGCPSCGSPEEPGLDGRCPSCGSSTSRGEMDWQVQNIEILDRRTVEPSVLTGGVETGTKLATIRAADLSAQRRDLMARDTSFDWQRFTKRVKHMFMEVQQGWAALDDKRLRPFETDTIFDAHRYQLERYRETGIRPVLDDIRISRIEVAKIEHDVWYDAITARIFASMIDYKVDAGGNVVAGSKTKPVEFSEYWTVIRRSDMKHHESRDPRNCPNCGAPLDRVNRAGLCEYCNSKIVSGNFDWVLAIIEQDEEYVG